MSRHALLSFGTGVPLALLAAALLFWCEARPFVTRRSSKILTLSTVVVCAILLVLIVGRFIEYA